MISRSRGKDILELETRRIIYNYILKHPGLHLRALVRELRSPKTTMNYHLNYLEKHEMVVGKTEKGYRRYYISQKVGVIEKEIINIIRQYLPRKIILFLYLYPEKSRKKISMDLEKPITTISFHLKKLIDKEIIEKIKNGREYVYRLKNQKEIYKLLIRYEDTLSKDITLADLISWIRDFYPDDGLPKRNPKDKTATEDIMELLLEMFPHPYHP